MSIFSGFLLVSSSQLVSFLLPQKEKMKSVESVIIKFTFRMCVDIKMFKCSSEGFAIESLSRISP